MNSYITTVKFNASTNDVYQAITTETGIKGWWTVDCDVNNRVGGVHNFRFERMLFNSMKVVELVPSKRVHWECVNGWKEWLGTEVIFTLSETNEGGAEMTFEHKGLTPDLKCYKMCSNGWDNTLKSLVAYVDTGKGKPHVPKSGLMGVVARTAFKVFSRKYTK